MILKIVSGGQTGVDIAAIDFAIENKIDYSGWVPKGRRCESGIIDLKYTNFKETNSSGYLVRTKLNTRDSNGTLIILPFNKPIGMGSKATAKFAEEFNKPFMYINLYDQDRKECVLNWINENNIKILNVAGAREETTPGIYKASKLFLNELFK